MTKCCDSSCISCSSCWRQKTSSDDENLHDAQPNGNNAKPSLSYSERARVAQFILLQASQDGKLRNGAINAAAEKFGKMASNASGDGRDMRHTRKC